MNCTARTQAGAPCSRQATHYGRLCRQHHDIRVRDEPAFAAEVAAAANAHQQRAAPVRPARVEPAHVPVRAAAAAEAQRLLEEARARRRETYIAMRTRLLAQAAEPTAHLIIETANKIMYMWEDHTIEGYDIPRAYILLTRRSVRHEAFGDLFTAAINLRLQSSGNEDVEAYTAIPPAARAATIAALTTAVGRFPAFEPDPRSMGSFDAALTRRRTADARRAEEARLEAARAEAARAEAARRAALNQRLREEPVVFERDPENGINLRAFATDRQSVHRSSVQNATHKAVLALIARPIPEGLDSLFEAVSVFQHPNAIRWADEESRELAITELTNDYFNIEAFSIRYGVVFDHVWAYIREHEHRATLQTRLAQEVCEGYRMCSNGKMARLVNVLQGFDETLETEAPKEAFQARIALLMKQPMHTREASARALFEEFNIPAAEHDVWLEPLLEEDEAPPAPLGGAGVSPAPAQPQQPPAPDMIVID
jgi:hypothetical protein